MRFVLLILLLLTTSCIQSSFEEVKVVRVVDGDTFYADAGGKTIKVRILGIDAPEIKAEMNKPYEYDEITNLSCLAEWGKKATDFLKERIEGKVVLLKFDERAGRVDKYGRVLAYVYCENADVAAEMLKLGYARVFVSDFEKLEEYLSYQKRAVERKIGLWSCGS